MNKTLPTPAVGHVALFVRSLGGGGGAERVMHNLAGSLASTGQRVDLVMSRWSGRLADQIPDSVNAINLTAPIAQCAIPSLLRRPGDAAALASKLLSPAAPRVLGAIPGLARYLEREQPSTLLAALNYTNIAALIACDLADVSTRCVISVHNHTSAQISAAGDQRTRGLAPLMRRFFPRADGIVAVSSGVADDLSRVAGIPRERIHTIYNPVVTSGLARLRLEEPDHPWLVADAPPVILGAGKLKPQKDFSTLVRAFAKVRRSRPARLIVLGEGPQMNQLRRLSIDLGVGDDVDFSGFVDNPHAYMARARVFVLSSAWEGFGNVLVEAMAAGCPVVSMDCPSGPSEILEDGKYGPLVPVGDHHKLSEAIISTLDAPLQGEELKQRAAVFSDWSAARRYADVFRSSSADPSRGEIGTT